MILRRKYFDNRHLQSRSKSKKFSVLKSKVPSKKFAQNHNRNTTVEGLGLRVSPSDITPIVSFHVKAKNCRNFLLNENHCTERNLARVYRCVNKQMSEGVLFPYDGFFIVEQLSPFTKEDNDNDDPYLIE